MRWAVARVLLGIGFLLRLPVVILFIAITTLVMVIDGIVRTCQWAVRHGRHNGDDAAMDRERWRDDV